MQPLPRPSILSFQFCSRLRRFPGSRSESHSSAPRAIGSAPPPLHTNASLISPTPTYAGYDTHGPHPSDPPSTKQKRAPNLPRLSDLTPASNPEHPRRSLQHSRHQSSICIAPQARLRLLRQLHSHSHRDPTLNSYPPPIITTPLLAAHHGVLFVRGKAFVVPFFSLSFPRRLLPCVRLSPHHL